MLNVIKMDIYRLFHTVSTYVMIIATVLLTTFIVYMTKWDLDNMDAMQANTIEPGVQVEGDVVELNFGFYSNTNAEWKLGDIPLSDLMETQLTAGFYLVFISIFVSIFVYAEQKNGYVKNIAGQLPNKWMLVLSKTMTVALQVLVMFLMIGISMFLVGKICFGERLVFGSFMDLVKVFGGQYFLHFGFACLILCLCLIFKSVALSMTLGILISSKVVTMLYFAVNKLAEGLFKVKDFDMSRYTIEMGISEYTLSAADSDVHRIFIVALVYVAAAVLTASVVVQKRDVK